MIQPTILINQTDVVHVIPLDGILYCKADRGYCYVHLINGETIVHTKTLANLSLRLNNHFLRISQSISVNIHQIRRIKKKEKTIELSNGEVLAYTLPPSVLLDSLNLGKMQDETA